MDTCSACNAHLIWAISPTGAKSPIDYAPSADGNVLLLSPTGLNEVLAITLSKDALTLARERGLDLRVSHFVTCEHREQFKR